ncbi:MAG: hypothetical protein JW969_19995 [Spirochaetales bacterium]|nr:hypothetical protein [Spirochaetales bacterium]
MDSPLIFLPFSELAGLIITCIIFTLWINTAIASIKFFSACLFHSNIAEDRNKPLFHFSVPRIIHFLIFIIFCSSGIFMVRFFVIDRQILPGLDRFLIIVAVIFTLFNALLYLLVRYLLPDQYPLSKKYKTRAYEGTLTLSLLGFIITSSIFYLIIFFKQKAVSMIVNDMPFSELIEYALIWVIYAATIIQISLIFVYMIWGGIMYTLGVLLTKGMTLLISLIYIFIYILKNKQDGICHTKPQQEILSSCLRYNSVKEIWQINIKVFMKVIFNLKWDFFHGEIKADNLFPASSRFLN